MALSTSTLLTSCGANSTRHRGQSGFGNDCMHLERDGDAGEINGHMSPREKKDVQMAEGMTAGDDERLLDAVVAIETDIAASGGMEYEHDQRWTRPARARGARGKVAGAGDNKVEGADRLTRVACHG